MLICSIKHSGTHLIAKMFPQEWTGIKDRPEPNQIQVGHISQGHIEQILKIGKTMPVIVPIRHPYRVEESWRRRDAGNPLGDYQLLIDQVDTLNPHYIAIDTPERDEHVKALNQALNLSLENDWSVKNSKHHTYNLTLDELNPTDEAVAFYEDNKPFFGRFYHD